MSNGISPLGLVGSAMPAEAAAPRLPAAAAGSVSATGSAAAQGPYTTNPSSYIDPALGIVVIEFRAATGKVTSTIPTSRQIAAYRQNLGSVSLAGAGAAAEAATLPGAVSVAPAFPVTAAETAARKPAGTTLTA